jgi:hypothetical protein
VNVPVPLGVNGGICQSIVGTQVDHLATRRDAFGYDCHAGHMRERAKDIFGSLGDLRRFQVFAPDINSPCQAGMNDRDVWRSLLARGQGGQLNFGMIENDPDQFESRITRGSENADVDHGERCLSDRFQGTNAMK